MKRTAPNIPGMPGTPADYDLLAQITVPRREKDATRVAHLRKLQREHPAS